MTISEMSARTMTEACNPSSRAIGSFLVEYTAWLMGCGATCIRIEKNVGRIAASYGVRTEMTVMPRHIQLSVMDREDMECITLNVAVKAVPIDFSLNTSLSELSWRIADRHIPLEEAIDIFRKITVEATGRKGKYVPLLVAAANASFCRLFGGDAVAMAIVAAATLAGYMLKNALLSRHVDVRVVFIACAFVSSVLGSTGLLFGLGGTSDVALATSVLYLVPGIPLINSFSDMLYRHYLSAFCRFADAAIFTCCLSIGLCLGMLAMGVGMF